MSLPPPNPSAGPQVPAPTGAVTRVGRLRAAIVHLGLSAAVAALAAGLVFGLWYPSPFREISGGRELFFIVVAVDVVLGPLITLTVFDRRKPWRELRRDLAIVGLLQVTGLAYGLHTVYEARPVVLALEQDRLRVVRAIDLDGDALAKAPAEWQRLPLWGVQVVATRKPTPNEQFEAIDRALQGEDVGKRPGFWLPSSATAAALAAGAKPLASLLQHYPARGGELARAVAATGRSADDLKYLPLLGRQTDWVALVGASDGALVGYAAFDGF